MQTNAKFLWLFKVGTFSHTRVCACVSLWFRAASYLQRAVSDPVRSADITQRHVKCQEYRGADDHRDRNSSVTHTQCGVWPPTFSEQQLLTNMLVTAPDCCQWSLLSDVLMSDVRNEWDKGQRIISIHESLLFQRMLWKKLLKQPKLFILYIFTRYN